MYIKQVVIEGFKSFREQIATDPFSPKINCVVGANGSGKTNFFHAIQFVLSDLFQDLRSEDRHTVLHEGAGHQVLSAFVEIVFDNSDNRILVDKKEVRLRRMIGLKKDEYLLDGKHIRKTEVMNLLEGAGFSRSNPYYIVQQGKIASLTLMKDSRRLDLLKEIGGAQVFEEIRHECLKLLLEKGNVEKKIIQVLQCIDNILKELDEKKEELRKYQQLDKQRKSLEYTIYDKELNDVQRKLAEVEEARNRVSETSIKMYNSVLDAGEKFKYLEETLKDLTKEVQGLIKEKKVVEKRRTEAIKKHTELELDVKDLQEKIYGNNCAKEDAMRQLEILEREVQHLMDKLEKMHPSYENQVIKEKEITKGIMERENQLSILYQKQGRATQFSSKAARDKSLQKEIDDLERVLSSNLMQEKKVQDEICQLNTELKERDAYTESRRTEIATLESHISQSREGFSHHKAQRDKLQNERKYLWGKESELSFEIDKLRTEVEKAAKSLDHATPGDVRRALKSVKYICEEYKINGVFGPIIELLDCDERLFTAVEVTAGNNLFNVVVENDEIPTKIIKHLNSLKGGRITFIPLNRVSAPHVSYPQSSDVLPLLKQLQFSPNYSAAFAQVFARTVICRDLDVATSVARTDGLDCITLEGDQVSKKGGMTGGFYDHRRSKLKFMNIIKHNRRSINSKEKELEDTRNMLQEIDQKITKLIIEQQKVDAMCVHEKSELEQLKQDVVNANKKKQSISNALENKEKFLADVQIQIDQLRVIMAMKQAEMGTELIDHLTPEKKVLLSRLNPEIAELKEMLIACKTDRIETETRKTELETNLITNLGRRKHELEAIILSAETETLLGEAKLKRHKLDDAKLLVDDTTEQLKRVTKRIDVLTKQLSTKEEEKNELKTSEVEYERNHQDEVKKLEQLLSKRNVFLAKQEEYSKKIRELGPLSSDAFEMGECSIKELRKMLHGCNEQLLQFSHVNKGALDLYVNFTTQREEFQKGQAELDAHEEEIRKCISFLDQCKDEEIERTFKGIAGHFREVFSELVQGGHGDLVMIKKKDGDQSDDDLDEDGLPKANLKGRVEKYIGVKVKVSFTAQGETQSMKQLSGGQKTVVALALIFAIQRCDPAPFYLFDEMDAALDPQYRAAVGNMIRRLADMSNTQFITTTFRPELVKVADKIYGVTHKNSVSHVNVISKEVALDFIKHDPSHNAR